GVGVTPVRLVAAAPRRVPPWLRRRRRIGFLVGVGTRGGRVGFTFTGVRDVLACAGLHVRSGRRIRLLGDGGLLRGRLLGGLGCVDRLDLGVLCHRGRRLRRRLRRDRRRRRRD